MKKFLKIPVISLAEFEQRVIDGMLHRFNEVNNPQIYLENLMREGFMKLDKDNLGKFMEANWLEIGYVNPVVVDIGDGEFAWLVSGISAILVKKSVDK